MNQFSDWMQSNWFELGVLLVLCAILATAVWFARNILRSLRASQEQIGALLRMSFSDSEGHSAPAPLLQAALESADDAAPALHEPKPRGPSVLAISWGKTVNWLNAPMHHSGVSPWHKLVRWLQAPAGS